MSVPAHSTYESSSTSSSWNLDNSPSVTSPLHSRSLEFLTTISRAWQRLSSTYHPYTTMDKLRSRSFKVADFVPIFPLIWSCVCVALGRYLQGLPYAFLITLLTAILYGCAFESPLRPFLPFTGSIILSLWTAYWTLPLSALLQPAILSHPFLFCALLYLGPTSALRYYASVAGHANLVGTSLLIACLPVDHASTHLSNIGAYTGLNTGVQLFILSIYFPQHKAVGIPHLFICGYAAMRDPFGFVIGIMAAVNSCLYFLPKTPTSRRDGVSATSGSSLQDVNLGFSQEPNFWAFPGVPSPPGGLAFLDKQPFDRKRMLSNGGRNVARPNSMTAVPSVMVTQSSVDEIAEGVQHGVETRSPIPSERPSSPGSSSAADVPNGMDIPTDTSGQTTTVQRRKSVAGPREIHQRARQSLDLSSGSTRPLPMPPAPIPRRSSPLASGTARDPSKPPLRPPRGERPRRPHSHLSEETIHLTGVIATMGEVKEARWDDRYLQALHRLGESSTRSTYEVKDLRTGTVFVRKTYYPRQTSCNHIRLALSTLINSQEQPEASLNVLRCYGAYITDNSVKGVRAIFEYCEGGSLQSIGRIIAQRGGIVGEKVAARLAEGMLQGLNYLSGLNMVHFNIQPSNVFISRTGIVKLSEPEIPGEGAVALTDRFANSVRYASPERIRGQPSNISKSDIWAMGITLLEFIQSRYPYPEDLETVQLMMRIVEGQSPLLQDTSNVAWSSRMKEFFRQTLAADEVQRPIAWELLSDPWIAGIKQQNVSMERWIAEVRGWSLRR